MAEDRRRRDRDDEDEKEEINLYKGAVQRKEGGAASNASSEKFEDLMLRAEPMIEQINSLYNQFLSGMERTPPLERRKTLDQIMDTLAAIGKPTAANQFKYQTMYNQYRSYRDRWDKMMLDLEKGKIKRGGLK